MSYEVHFIFRDDWYLMKDKTWSKNRADAELMSEQQASDKCGGLGGGCGSMIVEEVKDEE